jgi:hypothetical protein
MYESNARAFLVGSGISTVAIFVYGIKTNRSWKYYLATLLFIPWAVGGIASAITPTSQKYRIESAPPTTHEENHK